MHWGGPTFVILIVAVMTFGKLANNWIRVRHGYAPEDGSRGRRFRDVGDQPDDRRKVALLTNENERLSGQVGRLEERIAVLERIATDPAERTAREIDALRDR